MPDRCQKWYLPPNLLGTKNGLLDMSSKHRHTRRFFQVGPKPFVIKNWHLSLFVKPAVIKAFELYPLKFDAIP